MNNKTIIALLTVSLALVAYLHPTNVLAFDASATTLDNHTVQVTGIDTGKNCANNWWFSQISSYPDDTNLLAGGAVNSARCTDVTPGTVNISWPEEEFSMIPGNDYYIQIYFDNSFDYFIHQQFNDGGVSVTPTPSDVPDTGAHDITIQSSPSDTTQVVGTPYNVNINVTDTGAPFNAAKANITVSSNLTINGIHTPTSNACNLQYTVEPTKDDPSFAGAVFGSSKTDCTVYTMTVTPNAQGTGTITFNNIDFKSYADNSTISSGKIDSSFTLANLMMGVFSGQYFTVDNVTPTYLTSTYLFGTKTETAAHILVNTSEAGMTYPTTTSWQVPVNLNLGDNLFVVNANDDNNLELDSQRITLNRHTLVEINGDGNVDLIDASLFAMDWGKTSGLTYNLSDMNGDGDVDLTDLSILAKLEL